MMTYSMPSGYFLGSIASPLSVMVSGFQTTMSAYAPSLRTPLSVILNFLAGELVTLRTASSSVSIPVSLTVLRR